MTQTKKTPTEDLGNHAARGFAWLGAQSAVEKLSSGVGQVVLAWILVPDAFKLVALTYTITVFATLLQSAGIREVLQQRQKRLDLWVTPAFWLSFTIGLACGIGVCILSPLVARFYGEPELRTLLLAASFALPLSAMGIVPEVVLRSRMRFRMIAGVGSIVLVGQTVLSITFALLGFGAMSLILPQPILALLRLALYWRAARPRIRHGPRPRRWRYLFGDSSAMLIGSIALMVTYQAGQMILARLFPDSAAAGIYYFCAVLADQSVRVLTLNLAGVLLPTLSKIQDDAQRLSKAVLNATGLMLLVGVPICALQAALAGPIFRVFFNDNWLPAIGCFAALSVAAIGRLVQCPAESMLHAVGRFRTYMTIAIFYSIAFVSAMLLTAHFKTSGDITMWVAASGGACLLILGPVMFIFATRRPQALLSIFGLPLLLTAVSLLPTAALLLLMPRTFFADLTVLVVGPLTCAGIYFLLAQRFARTAWMQLGIRLSALLPSRFRPLAQKIMNVQHPADPTPANA